MNGEQKPLTPDNVMEHWNSEEMRGIRMSMLEGRAVEECVVCHDQASRGLYTMRDMYNKQHLEDILPRIEEARTMQGALSVPPTIWDLSTGNTCNLACRICSPTNSSKMETEFKKSPVELKEPLKVLADDWAKKKVIYENDPDYFKEIVLKYAGSIESLKFQGGEPTVLPSFWETLEALVQSGDAPRISLMAFTNATRIDAEKTKILNHFKSGVLLCSIDAYGEENEFLRYPSKWSDIENSLQKLSLLTANWKVVLKSAISHYNCLSYDRLLIWADRFFKAHIPRSEFNVHEVVFPSHLRTDLVPLELRRRAWQRIENFMASSWLLNESTLRESSRQSLSELKRILLMPDLPEAEARPLKSSARIAIHNFDEIRSQKASMLFPHLSEIFA